MSNIPTADGIPLDGIANCMTTWSDSTLKPTRLHQTQYLLVLKLLSIKSNSVGDVSGGLSIYILAQCHGSQFNPLAVLLTRLSQLGSYNLERFWAPSLNLIDMKFIERDFRRYTNVEPATVFVKQNAHLRRIDPR